MNVITTNIVLIALIFEKLRKIMIGRRYLMILLVMSTLLPNQQYLEL
jgi:hypothetical protein